MPSSVFYHQFERHDHAAGIKAHTTTYCPGCGHGLVQKYLAEAIDELAAAIEDDLRNIDGQLSTQDVGVAVLERLRELDEVAYLRFASVYRAFDGLEDFEAEIALLRAERDLASTPPGTPP